MNYRTKSNVYCNVFGCKTFYTEDKTISFHWFPKENEGVVPWTNKNGILENIDKRRAWAINLKMDKQTLKKRLRICSKHFTDDCFFPLIPGVQKITRRLKKNAIPTQNLPKSIVYQPSPKKRSQRCIRNHNLMAKQNCKHVKSLDFSFVQGNLIHNDDTVPTQSVDKSDNPINKECHIFSIMDDVEQKPATRDFAVQVSTGDIDNPFTTILETKAKLITMTGIPSFEILDKIIEIFSNKYPDIRTHQLSVRERIILVFLKLKHELSFAVLSVFFKNVSLSTCRSIFITTVPLLGNIFCNLIYWPSREEIAANIPYCFENFSNVRVILDCTEVPIQKPKCLSCRIKLYSNYKSNFTLKFLIGVSPAGLITFVSEPYGGRASDNVIFEKSNLISILDKSDAIMVDRGFKVDNLCNEKGILLIRPPFLKGKKQFTRQEALETKAIASARVHIERVNQRIKTFKIFQNKFSWGHVNLAKDIMIIVCGICNLGSSIFSDEKFNPQ